LINYKEKHGIVDDNRTTFPKGIETTLTKKKSSNDNYTGSSR